MPISVLSDSVLKVVPLGMTSDYCPVCRSERRFRLAIAQHHSYALLVDRGPRGHAHHELTCTGCGCRMERPTEERPVQDAPTGAAVEGFEPEMLPIVRSRIDGCVRLEQARVEGKLKPEQREELIRHAMLCFARLYDEQPYERMTPLVKALLFVLGAAMLGVGFWRFGADGSWLWLAGAGLGIGVLIVLLTNWSHRTSPRMKARTWLARSLAPLDPTREEIRKVRAEMQRSRLNAGFRIRSDKLVAKIAKIRAG